MTTVDYSDRRREGIIFLDPSTSPHRRLGEIWNPNVSHLPLKVRKPTLFPFLTSKKIELLMIKGNAPRCYW